MVDTKHYWQASETGREETVRSTQPSRAEVVILL